MEISRGILKMKIDSGAFCGVDIEFGIIEDASMFYVRYEFKNNIYHEKFKDHDYILKQFQIEELAKRNYVNFDDSKYCMTAAYPLKGNSFSKFKHLYSILDSVAKLYKDITNTINSKNT